jgi:hypothetical protein
MDGGTSVGGRYVYADELAFLLGVEFEFENDDGSTHYFTPRDSWLASYAGKNPEIVRIIEEAPPVAPIPFVMDKP